ncbi:MAG: hypothetical protein ACREHC_04940 [Candidatus Levyibacteriota bacterium]
MTSPELAAPQLDRPSASTQESRLETDRQITFDERQRGVLERKEFFKPYKEEIKQLFHTLGKDDLWSEDPREFVDYIVRNWAGGEHGNSPDKEQFTSEQIAAAKPILDKLRLHEEVRPPDGTHYDDVVIVGGTTLANYRRVQFIQDLMMNHGIKADRITLWLGQRPRTERDGTNEEMLSPTGRFAGNDIKQNPWVQEELKKPPHEQFATETELGRVALLKAVPNGEKLMPKKVDAVGTEENKPPERKFKNIPPRVDAAYHFEVPYQLPDGSTHMQKFVIMNAEAVERPQGDPRHNTESSAKDWLREYAPPKGTGCKVLFISGNPHTVRTAQDTVHTMKAAGREDIALDIAGTSMAETVPIQSALGEVAWLIFKDVEKNYPKAA